MRFSANARKISTFCRGTGLTALREIAFEFVMLNDRLEYAFVRYPLALSRFMRAIERALTQFA